MQFQKYTQMLSLTQAEKIRQSFQEEVMQSHDWKGQSGLTGKAEVEDTPSNRTAKDKVRANKPDVGKETVISFQVAGTRCIKSPGLE
jgi:hypothetical protein